MNFILNINKEKSLSSFDVIRFLRRKFNERRMGFQGTLDVFAEGVLPVFAGSCTKIIPFLEKDCKEYSFRIVLGIMTDTLDMTGRIIKEEDFSRSISKEDVEKTINEHFINDYIQRVPAYSAVKIKGTPAYKLARRGESVETPSKKVFIHSFKIDSAENKEICGSLRVSPGFYVRQFACDLGEKLSTVGSLAELTRTESGVFKIEDSIRMEDAVTESFISVKEAFGGAMKTVYLEEKEMKDLKNGKAIECDDSFEGAVLALNKEESECIIAAASKNVMRVKRVIY